MPEPNVVLPAWAEEMRRIFRGGTVSQFTLHGNVSDLVPVQREGRRAYVSLRTFLDEILFAPYEVVLHYDRSAGLRAVRGNETFHRFLQGLDQWQGTSFAAHPAALPRDPVAAFEIVDRFFRFAINRVRVEGERSVTAPLNVAFVVDHAEYVVPRGEALQLSGNYAACLVRLIDWARDPAILGANVVVSLVAQNLADLAVPVVDNPASANVRLPLPDGAAIAEYVEHLFATLPEFAARCAVSREALPQRLMGLPLVQIRQLVTQIVRNAETLTEAQLRALKRALIEEDCQGLLDFIETDKRLADVAGHDALKRWLGDDARLLKGGHIHALPMGYLFCGRIGTGKTWLATCWAGELGIPCVVFRNFRDKWQGSTEGNLEKIFNILHALGQVIVFVDEADQVTGRRGAGSNDNGVSGRVYAMLAKEMSDTRNRGKILWIFATSRPDLLEVDLKRPGRLDVHIPLFPPHEPAERQALFESMARKVGIDPAVLPTLPDGFEVSGNELEALLVRARRRQALDVGTPGEQPLAAVVAAVLADYRPSWHAEALEYMDLLAVKECTDAAFLPPKFVGLTREDVDARLALLGLRFRSE